jgi:hypothetical protein
MANTVTVTKLLDGPRNLHLLVNIAGDGSGEETNRLLVDRSAYAPVDGTKLVVEKIDGHLTGFSARLSFDATADLEIAQLPDGEKFEYCFEKSGGIASSKAGAGANGDILLTTASLGNGDRGTFTLCLRKN